MRAVEKNKNIQLQRNSNKIKSSQTRSWWKNIEALVFPPVCGICGKLNENYLCSRCYLELQKDAECKIENYITETGFKRKHFDEHIYFFRYYGLIREQIIAYKFNDAAYKYKAISNFILKNSNIFQILNDYEIIIPVPVSKQRFKERGYNQAELIAKQISKFTEKELVTNCLYKNKNIIAQSTLNKEEREENIKGVYILKNQEKLLNKKVLLIDDIYTTGSTANECCRVIKMAGTSKIGVMTIAKD